MSSSSQEGTRPELCHCQHWGHSGHTQGCTSCSSHLWPHPHGPCRTTQSHPIVRNVPKKSSQGTNCCWADPSPPKTLQSIPHVLNLMGGFPAVPNHITNPLLLLPSVPSARSGGRDCIFKLFPPTPCTLLPLLWLDKGHCSCSSRNLSHG